jgi:hypothetical protein
MDQNSVTADVATATPAAANTDKELNFAQLRKQKDQLAYQLEAERAQRNQEIEALKAQMQELKSHRSRVEDEEDSSEPYVDNKRLDRKLQSLEQKFDRKVEERARAIVNEENQKNFMVRLRSEYKDFDDVLTEDNAAKLEQTNPKLAQLILNVPDEYQRRLMAYEAIKLAGFNKKAEPVMQAKVDQNARNPYYHPQSSGSGTPTMGDFSKAGQKAAYEKMKALQSSYRAR